MRSNYSSLIGISHEEKNCWDIAVDFYRLVFDLELKHYYGKETPNRIDTSALIYSNKGDFVKVDQPVFGDLIIFSIHGIESHIGIYIDQTIFFHSSKTTGSVHDRLDRWKTLIVGYYRPEAKWLK